MSEEKLYQPGWEEAKEREKKKHRHHHHYEEQRYFDERSNPSNKRLGGALRMVDKQAYIGLMLVVVGALLFIGFKVGKVIVAELRDMPNDDPATEMNVDELRIRKVDEQDALLLGDSLAREYNVDSLKRKVQIDTRPVYRPPRKSNEWYITQREWKAIWKEYKIWKLMRKKDKEQEQEEE